MKPHGNGSVSLATVTHARLRIEQGDTGGAKRILLTVLAQDPDDVAALALMERLGDACSWALAEPSEEAVGDPVPGDPSELVTRFHEVLGGNAAARRRWLVEGLEAWLQRAVANRGVRDAR